MKAVVAALLVTIAQGSLLREAVQQELSGSSNPNNNNPICYAIFDQEWWKQRKSDTLASNVSAMDTYCKPFSGQQNNETCNSQAARQAQYDSMGAAAFNAMYYGGTATAQDMTNSLNAACTMIGAHNGGCIGNPCNSLNEGSCQLSTTQGVCVWYTAENVQTINKYRAADPANRWGSQIPGHGCYRNPCNIPGTGKQSNNTCIPYSVPDLYNCTYCKSANDPVLSGQGMGCQMTMLDSWNINMCAPVRVDSNVPAGSIYGRSSNLFHCQCSNRFSLCNDMIVNPAEYPDRGSPLVPVA